MGSKERPLCAAERSGGLGPEGLPGESCREAVERYLRTGAYDSQHYAAFQGGDFLSRARHAHAVLRGTLVEEVARRAARPVVPEAMADLDPVALTRARLAPMVRGLFPRSEQELVLQALDRSVVFLTPANIEAVLRETTWHHTARTLANLYLASVGAEPLGGESEQVVGLSEETTCYVSMDYFRTTDPFADYIVHEAAHVFHNCKRKTVGLPESRRREWLLPIDFRRRELFAYACEAYSRILALGDGAADRKRLVSELKARAQPLGAEGETEECLHVLGLAVISRNGWKRILEYCSRPPQSPFSCRGLVPPERA